MLYILGILTGLLLAVICMLSVRRYQKPLERTIAQVENKFKEKGEVFIPNEEEEELKNFLDNLPKI